MSREERGEFRDLDDLRRAELPPVPRVLADTLDEWLFRMHGVTSGGHYVGAFLTFLDANGLAIANRPGDKP